MNISKIKNVKLSLMEKETEDISDHNFIIHSSVSFKMPKDVDASLEIIQDLLESMYADLKPSQESNYLGLWVEYGNKMYESSISLETLNIIKENQSKPIYEFFIMTLNG